MAKGNQKVRFTFPEIVTIIWFLIDAFTHLTIELGYVYLALTSTAAKSNTFLGHIWREYGRADARWAIRDANVISIEIATVTMGLLCIVQIYGLIKRSNWRHVLQVIICVAELYGGWMTFAPGEDESYISIISLMLLSYILMFYFIPLQNGSKEILI